MSEVNTETKIIKDELKDYFNWFCKNILKSLQGACEEFLPGFFSVKLVSASKNTNILFQGDDYFVTKIKIDRNHDVFLRCSSNLVRIILDKLFNETKDFALANITELEAKIISAFSNHLCGSISQFWISSSGGIKGARVHEPAHVAKKKATGDIIHLTFFIKDSDSQQVAKFIISIPQDLISPNNLKTGKETFNIQDFKASPIQVGIQAGTTTFALKEIKNLEKDDIVVFDNSNIHSMKLLYQGYEKSFKIAPNPGLVTTINNGGNNMEKTLSQDLWDNIQVEMSAEFEKIKISLGDLKTIEEGLVVDISSIYDNKISLKVEKKVIAKGELVIINDRYGVRIDEVFASEKDHEVPQTQDQAQDEAPISESQQAPEVSAEGDKEFDYSDFELDDQDI